MLISLRKSSKICRSIQKILNTPPSRNLNLMEFQSKRVLQKFGLKTQDFCLVNKGSGFRDFDLFETKTYVVKAQVLTGGRGKGHFENGFQGGVKITKDKAQAKEYITKMLGHRLMTAQTPKGGIMVHNVMIEEGAAIVKETYVCLIMDRLCNGPVLVVSPEGGMDIETVATKTPSLIKKIPIDIFDGPTEESLTAAVYFLRFKRDLHAKAKRELLKLWNLFIKVDALQIEINPLATTESDEVCCIDAKFNFDDNAKFRQNEIFSLEDLSHSDPKETEATQYDLNYIKLDGSIGCLVNGAGLAMATMDIIKLFGGEPANFLDIGGSVTYDQIKKAFEILTSDENVKVILINVFGGIVNCELVARAICSVAKSLKTPAVVRLEGTNAVRARQILDDAKLDIETADNFQEAAQKTVSLLRRSSDDD